MTRSSNEIAITGSIQSFSIQTGTTIGSDQPLIGFPISFTGHLKNHELFFDPVAGSSSLACDSPIQTAFSTLQRGVFTIPLQAGIGTTWQDSITSIICTGSLALKTTDLKSYKIIGETQQNSIPAFVIDRTQKTLFSGEGSQNQHQIKIKGESAGTGRVYADRSDGSLLSLTAETKTTLQVQTSGRIQPFLQISRETVNRNQF